jgi:hypothetical protein
MFILTCRIFHGRDPYHNDIIRTERHNFTTKDEMNKWIEKTFTEKSIFWLDYNIKHNGVITNTANNANFVYNGKNYRSNR